MTSLDDLRRKKRKKGDQLTLADLSATPEEGPRPARASSADGTINFAAYLRHVAAQDPARRAVSSGHLTVSGEVEWTPLDFATLDAESDRLARGILDAAWPRGQRVLVLSEASGPAITALFALMKAGAVPVLVEPGADKPRLQAAARAAGARVLVADLAHAALRLLPGGPLRGLSPVFELGSVPMRLGPIRPIASLRRDDAAHLPLAATRPLDAALVRTSWGGSGPPRAIILDHSTLIAQAELLRRTLAVQPADPVMAFDLLHALLLVALGATLVAPGVSPEGFRGPGRIARAIDAQGVVTALGTPAAWRAVADHCAREARVLPSLRRVALMQDAASASTLEALARVLPSGDTLLVYGMAEAVAVAAISGREALEQAQGLGGQGAGACLGRPLQGIALQIMDFGGAARPAAQGDVGEIVVAGQAVAASASMRSDAHGDWLRTGDLGWMDRSGRIWWCGRVTRTSHARFGPVYAATAEAVFATHDRVARCALLPVGAPGQHDPVLVVEPARGRWPKDDAERVGLQRELLELGQAHSVTRGVRRVLFVKRLPVRTHGNLPELVARVKRELGEA